MATQPFPRLSHEEYLKIERAAQFKSEYIDGMLVAMAGASNNHVRISANALGSLWSQLRGSDCEAKGSDGRVRAASFNVDTYPDVSVTGGTPQYEDKLKDTTLNPRVIIEVLSPSTQNYDRIGKFRYYPSISTLQDYVLLAQDRINAEHYARQTDGSWLLREYTT